MAALTAATAAGVSLAPVAIKAIGELHQTVFLSNNLARQGQSLPKEAGALDRSARRRAAGVSDALMDDEEPSYLKEGPSRPVAGDLRKSYEVKRGSATSSKGILTDILAKVPRKMNGGEDYQRIARPPPSRQAGFGNQSFTP